MAWLKYAVVILAMALWWKFRPIGSSIHVLMDARGCPRHSPRIRENAALLSDLTRPFVVSHMIPYPEIPGVEVLMETGAEYLGEQRKWQLLGGFVFPVGLFVVVSACADPGVVRFVRDVVTEAKDLKIEASKVVFGAKNLSECFRIEMETKLWKAVEKTVDCSEPIVDGVRGEMVMFVSWRDMEFLRQRDPEYSAPLSTNFFYRWRMDMSEVNRGLAYVSVDGIKTTDDTRSSYERELRSVLFKKLGLKRIYRDMEDGDYTSYGECSKDTQRCFPTIVDDSPDYLFRKRWTPSCCLANLRKTLKRVVQVLEECKIRYWLEGGSLLGAARHNDIIPWDSDIDIGAYSVDVFNCSYFQAANNSKFGVIDSEGFLWERAVEGDFFRIHYSVINRLHVDLFPFTVNGLGYMTKSTWFKNHRQDCEFPEKFIKQLRKIWFAGIDVNVPSDISQFLEYKFGHGVVEREEYPRPDLLPFP